jgi:HEPN superfamily AbiU2-like protein
MFGKLTTAERVRAAKQKTERVMDHLLYLLALHESNAVIFYTDTLSAQIPRSYAAHAFNLFRQCMSRFEIVRLCALWDRPYPDLSRESIPTIIALIDNAEVIEALVEETRASWTGESPVDPSEEPETDAAVRELLGHLSNERAQEEAAKARDGLTNSIAQARKIESSTILRSARNLRDKHLAHSLSETSQQKKGTVLPVQPGDERNLLLDSIPLVKALHLWVNGKGFSFDNSREIARKNAEELWKHCTFKIQS